VVFKGLIAAASAVALMTAPTVAAAQTAAPTMAVAAMAQAGEDADDDGTGGFIIPLIAVVLIALGLCIATEVCGGDKDGPPVSP
jgi:hypothetical protein